MSLPDGSLIPYRKMMERALRGLVRETLALVSTQGLPGDHHFYISFRTQAADVDMPAHLRARYPEEMTIVLQHQFWGLETDETGFSVTLSFGGRSERLRIPFEALTAFMDPAVEFGLELHRPEAGVQGPPARAGDAAAASGTVVTLDKFRKK